MASLSLALLLHLSPYPPRTGWLVPTTAVKLSVGVPNVNCGGSKLSAVWGVSVAVVSITCAAIWTVVLGSPGVTS